MAGRFSVEAVFTAVDRMTSPVRRMQAGVTATQSRVTAGFRKMDKAVSGVTESVTRMGVATGAALAGAAVAVSKVVNAGADFEQSLVNAAAKFPGEIQKGSKQFKVLQDAALKAGASTEFTATSAASALNYLAMSGFNAQQSVSALPGVIDLATASGTDLTSATDMASDALGAFGLMTKDTAKLQTNLARVNDVMAKTTTTSNTDMDQLFQTLKKGGPTANSAGASLETVAAMAGIMANSGIKAELAGTAIQNMFLNLLKPSSEAAKVMKRIGFEIKGANGELLDMPAIIDNFTKSTKNMTKAQRTAVATTIFGREGLAGMIAVLARGGKGLREYRSELEGATGSASKMASMMRDTTRGSMNALNSVIESTVIKIFMLKDSAIKGTIDRMAEWVRANQDLIVQRVDKVVSNIMNAFDIDKVIAFARGAGQVIAALILLKGAMLVARVAVLAFNTACITVKATLWAVRAAMVAWAAITKGLPAGLALARAAILAFNIALRANPIGMVITAVGLLVGAVVGIYKAWGPVKKFFGGIWEYISEKVGAVINLIKKVARFLGILKKTEDGANKEAHKVANAAQTRQISAQQNRATRQAAARAKINEMFVTANKAATPVAKAQDVAVTITPSKEPQDRQAQPAAQQPAPQVLTQGDRTAAAMTQITENRETAEIVIKDETGRAAMSKHSERMRSRVSIVQSGD